MMIKFKCNQPDCHNHITKYFKAPKDIPPFLDCGACGVGKLERCFSAPSTNTTQIIDNGNQARQVEISKDVIDQNVDRLIKKVED